MRRGEKVFLLLLPLATKHWNLSLVTRHWNLPLPTKLGSSFTSFLFFFLKRANWDHLGLYFSEDNF